MIGAFFSQRQNIIFLYNDANVNNKKLNQFASNQYKSLRQDI